MAENGDSRALDPIDALDRQVMMDQDARHGPGWYYVVVQRRDLSNYVYELRLNSTRGTVLFREVLATGRENRPDLQIRCRATIRQGQNLNIMSGGVRLNHQELVVKIVRSSTQILTRGLLVEQLGSKPPLWFNS